MLYCCVERWTVGYNIILDGRYYEDVGKIRLLLKLSDRPLLQVLLKNSYIAQHKIVRTAMHDKIMYTKTKEYFVIY